MRLVSLLPAATDWLCAFGAEVVGRSHACDAPEARGARVLTRPSVALGAGAEAIDRAVRGAVEKGLSLFHVDLPALRALRADLVVTQSVCGVCAVPHAALQSGLQGEGSEPVRLVDFAPATFKDVLDEALGLGRAVGRLPEAMAAVSEGEARLRRLADGLGLDRRSGLVGGSPLPTAVCVEWVAPPMTAGHWTPDLAAHAGGRALLSRPGERSAYTTWAAIAAADPDVLVVSACGRSVAETLRDLAACASAWRGLRAVREGRAWVAEGDRLFNRPGPALVRSAEVLAAALHPARAGPRPGPSELAPLRAG